MAIHKFDQGGEELPAGAAMSEEIDRFMLHLGRSEEVLRNYPDNHFDSVVCDPPYHLISIVKRFGKPGSAPVKLKKLDGQGGSPYARGAKGFMGKEWDGGDIAFQPEFWSEVLRVLKPGGHLIAFSGSRTYHRMTCGIEDAGFEIRDQIMWLYGSGFPKSHNIGDGWGSALKPAHEPIVLARKPLTGTIAGNVQEWGTGAINIDGCRVGLSEGDDPRLGGKGAWKTDKAAQNVYEGGYAGVDIGSSPLGRWPANVVHDGLEEEWARFFYCAKASKADRGSDNTHPTVKPTDLMRYLCRLVTPPGGLILDPFMGSGSTGKAAMLEGFRFVGIDVTEEYIDVARARIQAAKNISTTRHSDLI